MVYAVGQRIGRYSLVRMLGRGGAGEVWEAVLHGPRGFARAVALKLLRDDALARGHALDDLVREARIGALLQHPNVVGTHELGEIGDQLFIAMELVHGPSVRELARAGSLGPTAILDLGIQACAGLGHIHRLKVDGQPAGVVHRDVKPGNLLVDRTGLVKLADFGIAGLGGAGDRSAGTPGYSPPEQVETTQDARADLFSLGATLYAVAVRSPPFESDRPLTRRTVRDRLASHRFLELTEMAIPGLGAVLQRSLQPDPAVRFATAEELSAALAGLRAGVPGGESLAEVVTRVRPDVDPDRSTTGPPSHRSDTGGTPTATTLLVRGNLPSTSDSFVGRTEREPLLALLRDGRHRLVTLLGPGGMGKTRLSLEVARALGPTLPGGAWFFDLAEVRTTDGLCFALARGLSLDLDTGEALQRIGYALRSMGRALVVLDNLEQVVGPAADAVRRWLELAPDVGFVCTSRIALRLKGEQRFAVGALAEADGVALFVDRAAAPPREDELEAVRELVGALEGMPLAIELCAARTALLGLADIRARLGDRLRLLRSGERDRPQRQRSLQASLDWSWDLLSAPARQALVQLSVFEGGFRMEAAEAVVAPPPGTWAIDLLEELAEASLLRLDPDQRRFGMLAVVQAWAAERATTAERAEAEARHGRWAAGLGSREAIAALSVHGGAERFARLGLELDNVLAACTRAVARGDAEVAVPTARAAYAVLARRGPLAPLVRLLAAVRALPDLPAEAADELTLYTSVLAETPAEFALAREQLERAVERARERGDLRLQVSLLNRLGAVWSWLDQPTRCEALGRTALVLARSRGDTSGEVTALRLLGSTCSNTSRQADALRAYEAALAIASRAGDRRVEGGLLADVGFVHHQLGRFDLARRLFEEALPVHRQTGDRFREAGACCELGLLAKDERRTADAAALYGEALRLSREIGDRSAEGFAQGCLGYLHLEQGDPADAVVPLTEAAAVARELGEPHYEGQWIAALARHAALRGDARTALTRLDEADRALALTTGSISGAWVLAARVEVNHRLGHPERAQEAILRALRWAEEHRVAEGARAMIEIGRVRTMVEGL